MNDLVFYLILLAFAIWFFSNEKRKFSFIGVLTIGLGFFFLYNYLNGEKTAVKFLVVGIIMILAGALILVGEIKLSYF